VIKIAQTTRVGAPLEATWHLFVNMDEHYEDWHREHLRWRWLDGKPLEKGAVWFADEYFDWMRLSCRFFVTESDPRRFFSFAVGFPNSLVRAAGSFTFAPTEDGGTEITEEFHFGFGAPILGPVVDALLRIALPLDAFRRHIGEEGEGLVRLLGAPAT
jgi:hypothetical protein